MKINTLNQCKPKDDCMTRLPTKKIKAKNITEYNDVVGVKADEDDAAVAVGTKAARSDPTDGCYR